MGYFVTDLIPC